LLATGVNPDTGLVEIVEIKDHPFFRECNTIQNTKVPLPIRTLFLLILLQRLYKQRRNNRDVVKHLPKFGTNRLNTFKYYNGTKKFDLNSIIGFALIFGILVLSCTKTNRIKSGCS
jgi:hypothetical protein